MRLACAVLLGWLCVSTTMGCGESPAAAVEECERVPGSHRVFATADCPEVVPADPRLSCGTLELAEDPGAERSCRVSIAWVRYDPAPASDEPPVFVLGGGPGAVLVQRSDEVLALALRVAPNRSWIAHDPRGVGESKPRLDCASSEGTDWLAHLRTCAEEYRMAGHDSERYRTTTLAADVDALAEAFGEEQIVVFGASYGSRLGYAYASLYPERVHALVLDSATPLDAPLLEVPVGSYLQALDRVADDCSISASCSAWHGDVAALHEQNVEWLERDEPRVAFEDQDVPLSAELYVALTAQLAASPQARTLPAFIAAIADENLTVAEETLSDVASFPIATWVHHAIMCSEELPQNARSRAEADLARFPEYSPLLPYDRLAAQCDALDMLPKAGAAPSWDGQLEPIAATTPVLALTGRYDPLSVASNWRNVELVLPERSLFVVPDASHAARRSVCGGALIAEFLAAPMNGLALPEECSADPEFFVERFAIDVP